MVVIGSVSGLEWVVLNPPLAWASRAVAKECPPLPLDVTVPSGFVADLKPRPHRCTPPGFPSPCAALIITGLTTANDPPRGQAVIVFSGWSTDCTASRDQLAIGTMKGLARPSTSR